MLKIGYILFFFLVQLNSSHAQNLNGFWIGLNCRNLVINEQNVFITGKDECDFKLRIKEDELSIIEVCDDGIFNTSRRIYKYHIDRINQDSLQISQLQDSSPLLEENVHKSYLFLRYKGPGN